MVIADHRQHGMVATVHLGHQQLADVLEGALDVRLGQEDTRDLCEGLGGPLFAGWYRHQRPVQESRLPDQDTHFAPATPSGTTEVRALLEAHGPLPPAHVDHRSQSRRSQPQR